jgi:hypothetical protein
MSEAPDLPVTVSVPVFGKAAYDLTRSASYEAANQGAIPFIEVRGKKRVPVAIAARPLVGDDPVAQANLAARLHAAQKTERHKLSNSTVAA